jgi:hypothetical protein
MFTTPECRMLRWSVVFVGIDQVSVILSAFLDACKFLTGRGSSSEGGIGTPGLPQATSQAEPSRESTSFGLTNLMQCGTD